MEALEQVQSLLAHVGGLRFAKDGLPKLDPHMTFEALAQAADAYDACLAALPALYWLRPHASRHACLAGDEEQGQLLLLAGDRLTAQFWQRQVPVLFPGQGMP